MIFAEENIKNIEVDLKSEDTSIQLTCKAHGNPQPRIEWSRNKYINLDKFKITNY